MQRQIDIIARDIRESQVSLTLKYRYVQMFQEMKFEVDTKFEFQLNIN